MTERILGPTGSKRRRRFLWVPMLAIAAIALFTIGSAQGVPGGGTVFELDASLDGVGTHTERAAITDNLSAASAPDDWDRVANGTSHADATSFDTETASDGTADAKTIFTGGGSKDQQPLSKWASKDQLGGLPDKDNLLHAMSARYHTGAGSSANSYIFFGADRYDNSGDAQIGFWFFKNTVCVKADGTFGNTVTAGVCSGTAVHSAGVVPHNTTDPTKQGDILILSDFTNGGVQPTIRIFEYVGSGGSDGELNLIGGGVTENRDCAAVSGDSFCASVNNFDGAVAPWLFKNKSGQSTFGHGEFYEGGLNLNTLGLQNECFSSFLAETRSSQSVTATLKDFVLGGFEACRASVATTPVSAAGTTLTSIAIGDSIYDHAVITGTGSNQNPTGTMDFYLCSPSQLDDASATDDPATCDVGGTASGLGKTVTAISGTTNSEATSNVATPNALGTWCWRGHYSGDSRYPSADDFSTGECFTVTDVASTTTAQSWLPQDTATVTSTGNSVLAGSVTFTLYETANCSGTVAQTFASRPLSASAPYTASTNNTTYYTTTKTISWRAVFTSTNGVASGNASHCETMSVNTLNNDTGS